jgi:hypothetical protein
MMFLGDTSGLAHPSVFAVGLLLLYCLSLAIHRLFFSAVAKFPGPKLAALTFKYEFYFDVVKGGQYTFEIGRMHERYGQSIRQTSPPSNVRRSDCPYKPIRTPHPRFRVLRHALRRRHTETRQMALVREDVREYGLHAGNAIP